MRILRQAHCGASNAVPFLPRSGSTGATVAPHRPGREAPDSPRPSLHATRRCHSLFCRRLCRPLSDSIAGSGPSARDAIRHAAPFSRGPGHDALWPHSPREILTRSPSVRRWHSNLPGVPLLDTKYSLSKATTCTNGQRDRLGEYHVSKARSVPHAVAYLRMRPHPQASSRDLPPRSDYEKIVVGCSSIDSECFPFLDH